MFSSLFTVTFCPKFLEVEGLMRETRVRIRTDQYAVKGICEMESRACYTSEVVLKSVKTGVKESRESRGKKGKHLMINSQNMNP